MVLFTEIDIIAATLMFGPAFVLAAWFGISSYVDSRQTKKVPSDDPVDNFDGAAV